MVAGARNVDYPGDLTALSILQIGRDIAVTSRVRRVAASSIYVTPPRDHQGNRVRFELGDLLELSWQAEDGLRSVPTEAIGLGDDGSWRLQVTGPATRVQRRDAVRAPIGLPVTVIVGGRVQLVGSTVDLSEGGTLCVFRANGELGVHVPMPKRGQVMTLSLDLYSDVLTTEVELIRRRPRDDGLNEWSLRFVQLPESAADLIRSHVFTALRNARARGLASLY
jgi:PilZ domain